MPQVASHGYELVDGLDASLGMLGQARKQMVYQDYIVATVLLHLHPQRNLHLHLHLHMHLHL